MVDTPSANCSPGASGRQTPHEVTPSTAPNPLDYAVNTPATGRQTRLNPSMTTVGSTNAEELSIPDDDNRSLSPQVAKRHAQENWPTAYHLPKSVKSHEDATLEVVSAVDYTSG